MLGPVSVLVPDTGLLPQEAPTLKDALYAVNACKCSLNSLCDQLKGIKEELLLMGQELRRTVERTTALEERLSLIEDDLFPLKQEVKVLGEQMGLHASKMDEMENRLHGNNVRVVVGTE